MAEFNLNNWIENVVKTQINQAVAAMQDNWEQKTRDLLDTVQQKINLFEQHSRDLRITFEQNINTKLSEMFNKQTDELKIKIEEEVNKKYEIAKERFATEKSIKSDDDFEKHIMLKMDEKIESKSDELSVTFQAQIMKELEQVMGVFQQILNNGLDLDKNIGQKLAGKFQAFLDSNSQELDKVLKEKINGLLNNKENNLEDKLEQKINIALEKNLKEKTGDLIKEYEEKGAKAFEGKLNSENGTSMNENVKKLDKRIGIIAKDMDALKIKLEQTEKLFAMQSSREKSGKYINWDDIRAPGPFFSIADIEGLCFKLQMMYKNWQFSHDKVNEERARREKYVDEMKTHVVKSTIRFPHDKVLVKCADLEDILQQIVKLTYSNSFRSIFMHLITTALEISEQNRYNRESFERGYNLKWVADTTSRFTT